MLGETISFKFDCFLFVVAISISAERSSSKIGSLHIKSVAGVSRPAESRRCEVQLCRDGCRTTWLQMLAKLRLLKLALRECLLTWPSRSSLVQYFVFTGVLAMVTCAVFLRLNSILKLAVLLVMIAIYSLLTEAFYASLFVRYDTVHHNTE